MKYTVIENTEKKHELLLPSNIYVDTQAFTYIDTLKISHILTSKIFITHIYILRLYKWYMSDWKGLTKILTCQYSVFMLFNSISITVKSSIKVKDIGLRYIP